MKNYHEIEYTEFKDASGEINWSTHHVNPPKKRNAVFTTFLSLIGLGIIFKYPQILIAIPCLVLAYCAFIQFAKSYPNAATWIAVAFAAIAMFVPVKYYL